MQLANAVKNDVILKQAQAKQTKKADSTETDSHETDSHETDSDKTSEDPIIAQDLKSLIKHGISNNNIWIFAGLAAPILNQFEDSLNWLITPEMRNTYEQVEALGPAAIVGSTIILGLIALAILMTVSVIASILIYYDYKLFRSQGRIFRQNGLLEKQQSNMEESKIQRIVIRQSAIGRFVGCFNVVFKQIGFIRNSAKGSKNFIVPSLKVPEYKQLTELLYDGLDWKKIKTRPIHNMYIRRMISVSGIPLLIAASLLSIKAGPLAFLIMGFLLILIPIFIQNHKRYRYALNGDYAIMQSGFIGKSISIFPMYKSQNIRIRQTPGQRRKNLATLKISIAGQTLSMPYIPIEDAYYWRNKILSEVEKSSRPWM